MITYMKPFKKGNAASCTLGLAIFLAAAGSCPAGQLNSTGWRVQQISQTLSPPFGLQLAPFSSLTNQNETPCPALFDNNPHTLVMMTNLAASTHVPCLLIDLAQSCSLDRVVVCGTNNGLMVWPDYSTNTGTLPLGLIAVYVGNTPRTMINVGSGTIPYDAGNPINEPFDIRFSPATGRYVRLELQTRVNWPAWSGQNNNSYGWTNVSNPVDLQWQLSEVELYGSTNTVATSAVVLEPNAPAPLQLAADDLSYYLSELTGQPLPIITPDQTNNYPGTLYSIVDLKPFAPDYPTMTNNMANGTLPVNDVNIRINGRVVTFTGWPYRCVCWSVWEFLERQGVRWVYPDVHGDYVPPTGVSLAMLPLTMQSSAKIIYANWDAGSLEPWPAWVTQSIRQEYLYAWRNRWNSSWNGGPIGGMEVPAQPATGVPLDAQYADGFTGYPHNVNSVLPGRILATNSAWWGSADGILYTNVGVQFEMASTPAELWIAEKVTNFDASYPLASTAPLSLNPPAQSYQILPMDATVFSIGTNMQSATNLYGGPNLYLPWRETTSYTFSGGAYYKLLATVASNAPNQLIGGLAYSDIFDPPKSNYPSNVRMEVTLWGSPNLPLSSPVNSNMWSALTNWSRACSKLANYDYALLFIDYWQTNPLVPVPMVSGLVGTAQSLAGIGALDGGSQAFVGGPQAWSTIQYNPWDFYAYPRIRWNTNYTVAGLESEFFTGYYKEAAAPMLAYYQAMENYQYSNNVDLHNLIGYCYWTSPGSFPRSVLHQMQTNLLAAQSLATNWYVINRINDATNSWWYCCTNQGITDPATLTNFSSFDAVPVDGTYTVNLGNMDPYHPLLSISGFYGSAGAVWDEGGVAGWHFDGATMMQKTLNFPSAGQYRVDVTSAAGNMNGYPSMCVYLGGAGSGAINFTNTSTVTNSFIATVSSPTALDLVVSQDNNGKFLVVSKIQITKQ
jgi:hypothetical protein